jgi:hypothetical protein
MAISRGIMTSFHEEYMLSLDLNVVSFPLVTRSGLLDPH